MVDLERDGYDILACALREGGDFAEIFLEETRRTGMRFEEGRLERVISGVDVGAGVRVVLGDRTLYAHTNDIARDGLLRVAQTVAAGAGGVPAQPMADFVPERFAASVKQSAQDVPTASKACLVAVVEAAARAYDPRIVQVGVHYGDSLRHITVVNSEGRFVEDVRPQIILGVQVVATQDGVIQTGFRPVGGTLGYELFDIENPEDAAREAARQACLMLDADPAPTGRMPVVLSSEAGGTMIHEAVGHGLEADHIDKGMSKYCGKLGEVIAVPEITVVDDGTLPGRRGTAHVDDEGVPMQRTVLIEHGRLVRFLNDLRTARKMGHEPTGNGRRESYQCKPVPRMTNTLICPGEADPAGILASTERGLYVRRMGGGQVNPLNGDFVFEVSEGYLIKNGKAETPVRGAMLIGNGPEVLLSIEAVGNDLGFAIGTCGKNGQGAPVSDAQPTLRIRELTIGGTGG
ncbi:MAG TPA: TldD/PmbA family protein [Candidatus Hydrogenedentes bacterium]|nr:TldD/PmbA family protein [Candidatus Hydrogenedentota bacterium]